MMAQCEIINKNTEQTLYETNAVSIYLSDTFNALSNLSNKKFIENVSISFPDFLLNIYSPWLLSKSLRLCQESLNSFKR